MVSICQGDGEGVWEKFNDADAFDSNFGFLDEQLETKLVSDLLSNDTQVENHDQEGVVPTVGFEEHLESLNQNDPYSYFTEEDTESAHSLSVEFGLSGGHSPAGSYESEGDIDLADTDAELKLSISIC